MKHRENTDLLMKAENKLEELTVRDGIHNEIKKVRKQVDGFPVPDDVQGYWFKNLSNFHIRLARQLDRCLQENNLPK